MPIIYLSPSTQEWNPYVDGGNEEYYMNLIADAMEPYLRANGIQFVRNTPDMTAASSIRASNAGNYDLHVALHSNAAPAGREGQVRGSEVYYAAVSRNGKRAADIIANNLKLIYPDPNRVRALTTNNLGEVTKTKAPAVLIEFAYHDNPEDAQWIRDNIDEIAQNVVLSLTEYFGIPFVTPVPIRYGRVRVSPGSYLNIRSRPALDAPVIRRAYNGETLAIVGQTDGWYVVEIDDVVGYAYSDYIVVA
ncbi:MAG TPA: N-acetylmuramoyl-L-alanine amidase [Firmicutes bacterium]|nr:N-acetylmuramoyl-L-alanine amidase [Bacillota bacterium]